MPAFLPFRPDAGEFASSEVSNVFMTAGGYGPRPTLQAAPGAVALPAAPRGAFGGFLPDGTFNGFVATASDIYTVDADFDFTALSASLTVPADEDQVMTQFGVFMLTTNTGDGMMAYNMDTPAGIASVAGAPDARYIFSANNQLVALGDGSDLNRLSVSAFGDHTNWVNKGYDTQDMNDGGAFTGGGDLGGGAAVLLQLRAVRVMRFGDAGGGAKFRLDKLADDVGCVHPRAQATYNGVCYFLHTDGFYASNGNGPPVNIGAGKVNNWFLSRCPDLTQASASIDPKNTIVRWRYPASGDGSTATVYNSILDYNWTTGEFVPGIEPSAAIFRMGTPGYVLDTLDTFGELDDWSQYPLGSAFFQGGNFRLAGLDADYKFGFFDGPGAAATLETPTEGDGATALVNWCEPVTDDENATLQVGVKDRISDALTWKPAVSINASGRTGVRARGKWRRYRLNHAAGASWTADSAISGIVAPQGGPR